MRRPLVIWLCNRSPLDFLIMRNFFPLFYLVYLSLWKFYQELNIAVVVKSNETRYENVHLHIVQLCISRDMEPKINFGDLPPYLTALSVSCNIYILYLLCEVNLPWTELHLLTNWQRWQKGFHSSLKIFFDYRRAFPFNALTW